MKGCYCRTCEGQRAYDRRRNQTKKRLAQRHAYRYSTKGLIGVARDEWKRLLRRVGR